MTDGRYESQSFWSEATYMAPLRMVTNNKNVSISHVRDWNKAHTVCGKNFPQPRVSDRQNRWFWVVNISFPLGTGNTGFVSQCCKSANMLFQKYVDLRRLYVLFEPRWPLVKLSWHQCKSFVCRVFSITKWITVLFPASDCLYRVSLSVRK